MKEIKTKKNLEAAFAGESMAYQKYLYFAKIARDLGIEEVAKLFEDTAKHETAHAHGHLTFLYPKSELTVEKLLEIAIEGETFEYTEMYPNYSKQALLDKDDHAKKEFDEQIKESEEHADLFKNKLEKISKIFAGLAKTEKHHADGYSKMLAKIKS